MPAPRRPARPPAPYPKHVRYHGWDETLSRREALLVGAFLERPEAYLTTEELTLRIWAGAPLPGEQAARSLLQQFKRKFPGLVENAHGFGYRLTDPGKLVPREHQTSAPAREHPPTEAERGTLSKPELLILGHLRRNAPRRLLPGALAQRIGRGRAITDGAVHELRRHMTGIRGSPAKGFYIATDRGERAKLRPRWLAPTQVWE